MNGDDDVSADSGAKAGPAAKDTTPVSTSAPDHTKRYGGFALRVNDRDDKLIYAGKVQAGLTTGKAPSPVAPGGKSGSTIALPDYVTQLQKDLRAVGIQFLAAPTGVFDMLTVWSVREFQCHAKLSNLAKEDTSKVGGHYLDRLAATGNSLVYDGPVSGVLNAKTADCLQHWLDNALRCPVVAVGTKTVSSTVKVGKKKKTVKTIQVVKENVWNVDDHSGDVYVRDFSGYYTFPSGRDANGLVPVATHTSTMEGGPLSSPPKWTWSEAKVTPENLTGREWSAFAPEEQSTFKVVRAWCELECIGYLDCINAWDNCVVSLGLCHWTFEIHKADTLANSPGELGGLMSYVEAAQPDVYAQFVGDFGLHPSAAWNDGKGPWLAGGRKFGCWWKMDGESGLVDLSRAYAGTSVLHDPEWFKTWHWIYRLEMASRTSAEFRNAMWAMARFRIRAVLTTLWGSSVADIGSGAAAVKAKIGDVITSERGVAFICRAHVWRPGWITSAPPTPKKSKKSKTKPKKEPVQAGSLLQKTLAEAKRASPKLTWNTDPSTWTDAHEEALFTAMKSAAKGDLIPAWGHMAHWPGKSAVTDPYLAGESLSVARGSFQLDETDFSAMDVE